MPTSANSNFKLVQSNFPATLLKMGRLLEVLRKKMLMRYAGHGLPNVFKTKSIYKKVMWSCLWTIGLLLSVYLTSQMVNDYFKYDVTITSRVMNEYPLLFPKVTICNMDPFTTNRSIDFLAKTIRQHTKQDTSTFKSNLELVNFFIENDKVNTFKKTIMFYSNLTDTETKKSFGYGINEFIYFCQFGVWECDLEKDFEWHYNYKLGNYFNQSRTFNSQVRFSLKVLRLGCILSLVNQMNQIKEKKS